jgi:F-type H+-transporting ATPase subunit b
VFLASNFLVPNATFVVELIAFLIVLGVLARYVLPPVNKAMTSRQETLRQALVDAETAKRRAEEAEADYRKTMDDARASARAMVDEASKQGEAVRAQKAEQAAQEYSRTLARATADSEALARRVSEDVRREVAGLVISVVEKVIGQGFGDADHQALIERAIAEVEADAASAPEVHA